MLKKLRKPLSLLTMLMLLIPVAAFAGGEDTQAGMTAYWQLVGNPTGTDPLTRVMNGDTVPLGELTAVTGEDILAFAAANQLPLEMAQYAWYTAMAEGLNTQITQNGITGETDSTLALFLSMPETWRDTAANTERRNIRRSLNEADIRAMSAETGMPAGFLAWLLLDDEWHEDDWDNVDDWREGRSSWDFADWVDERDLRTRYGTGAVVSDDSVEAALRQNGVYDRRWDDDDDWDDRWDDDDDDWDDRWDDDDDDWDDRWDD